jgi:hypothetical protein
MNFAAMNSAEMNLMVMNLAETNLEARTIVALHQFWFSTPVWRSF